MSNPNLATLFHTADILKTAVGHRCALIVYGKRKGSMIKRHYLVSFPPKMNLVFIAIIGRIHSVLTRHSRFGKPDFSKTEEFSLGGKSTNHCAALQLSFCKTSGMY